MPGRSGFILFQGNADLNAAHIISVVGTRRASAYGQEVTERLLRDLSVSFPDLLVVSGLRVWHRYLCPSECVEEPIAHGGRIGAWFGSYLSSRASLSAIEMLDRGGLLTDFPSGTNPDRQNFIRRNRIVAGLADATIVIESAEKGGSLITADIAFSYGRDVYAFPGRVTDINSKGCNSLIRQNKGGLITCADDLIMAMRWDVAQKADALPVQTQLLFPENEESERILSFLETQKESHINELSVALNLPVHQLSSLLFELELDGKIKSMPGSIYKRMKPL